MRADERFDEGAKAPENAARSAAARRAECRRHGVILSPPPVSIDSLNGLAGEDESRKAVRRGDEVARVRVGAFRASINDAGVVQW